jgi:GntR family transcriptional repressor for pyruvate dehydrogenase complex
MERPVGPVNTIMPIARPSITEEIVERITAFILDEHLKPGDKLPSERTLMARLAVGRSSLREAIKTLGALGIVEVQVGEGMFVGRGQSSLLIRPLSWGLLINDHSAREVIEARRLVEIEMAGLAAERASAEELATIADLLAAMRTDLADAEGFTRHDQAFHLAVANAARNSVLYHVLDTLRHIVRVWIFQTYSATADKEPGLREHIAIDTALRARNPAAARAARAAHLDAATARLLAILPGS